jgi:hypothetical protein
MAEKKPLNYLKTHPLKCSLFGLGAIFLFCFVVILANISYPRFFEPKKPDKPISGWIFVSSVIDIGDQMFANWLPNDLFWPTAIMDNQPNFQLGQLQALNYTVFRLKENLSRLRSSDTIDPDCAEAFTLLSNDPKKWIMPSSESRFNKAMDFLRDYRQKLENNQARFSPRADNLSELLTYYVSLLGTTNSDLARAPGKLRLKGFSGAITTPPGAPNAPKAPAKPEAEFSRVPFTQVDDNFYLAQGVAYVLRQMLVAIKIEFQEILEVKKATEIVDDIIMTLDQSQFEPWIVLNGDIGAMTANHSMELHSILENSRQKINNLIEMISQ